MELYYNQELIGEYKDNGLVYFVGCYTFDYFQMEQEDITILENSVNDVEKLSILEKYFEVR